MLRSRECGPNQRKKGEKGHPSLGKISSEKDNRGRGICSTIPVSGEGQAEILEGAYNSWKEGGTPIKKKGKGSSSVIRRNRERYSKSKPKQENEFHPPRKRKNLERDMNSRQPLRDDLERSSNREGALNPREKKKELIPSKTQEKGRNQKKIMVNRVSDIQVPPGRGKKTPPAIA